MHLYKYKIGVHHSVKSRRGLSTIVGIVFFIIVFTGVASYVTYSMNHLDQFGQTIIEKSQDDRNRDREQFEISSVSRDNNKFNITIQNTGELPINITRLWIQNKTDPSWGTSKFDVNKNVSPGQTLTKIGQNLPLTALTTQGYDIRLTTERGNAKEFLVNSVSQEPVYLQLFALPDDLPTGYTATLLLAVTNNMSNNGVLTNFKPNTPVITYPVGASVTPLSGPEPLVYSSLAKGDTAYFQWTYRITGSNGQQVKFEASLQNGYLANSVSNNVTINVAGGATKGAEGYHRTGGTNWYSSNIYGQSADLTEAATHNVTRAFPFIVGSGFTANRIQFEITAFVTGANSFCNVGIYNDNGNLYPSTLVVDGGQKSTQSNGVKFTDISTSLSANTLYWLVYNCHKTPTFRSISPADIPSVLGWDANTPGASRQITGWTAPRTYASTLPATFPAGGTPLLNVEGMLIQVRAQ